MPFGGNPPVPLQPGEGVIRCPAIRSLVKDGKLKHQNLETASVQDLVHVFSGGQDDSLGPNQPGSLANVAGFFAIFNHGIPEHPENNAGIGLRGQIQDFIQNGRDTIDAIAVAVGKSTSRKFSLRLFRSDGDHSGTVNFFEDNERGEFQADHFESVMNGVSDGNTLTIEGIAKMIIEANDGDSQGKPVDLAKSSGEWALMVCALRASPEATDISIADLEQMYSQADSTKLLEGTRRAAASEWLQVTAQIAAAIADNKGLSRRDFADTLHTVFKRFNTEKSEPLCPCKVCNPQVWLRLLE